MKTVIGIDPDNKKHGVAVYENDTLVKLGELSLMEVMKIAQNSFVDKWVVEEVTANNFVYGRNVQKGKTPAQQIALNAKIARNVGMNQQAMTELVRVLKHYNQRVKMVPPQKSNWAKDRARFERMTGWKKQSNEDTRSAAFFGFLGL